MSGRNLRGSGASRRRGSSVSGQVHVARLLPPLVVVVVGEAGLLTGEEGGDGVILGVSRVGEPATGVDADEKSMLTLRKL